MASKKTFGIWGVILTSVITAIATAYLSFIADNVLASRNEAHDYNKFIIEKRLDLISDAAALIGEQPGIQDIWASHVAGGLKNLVLSEKLAGYNKEYSKLLLQSSFLFGSQTQQFVASINSPSSSSPWWERDRDVFFNLIEIMKSELYVNLSTTNQ